MNEKEKYSLNIIKIYNYTSTSTSSTSTSFRVKFYIGAEIKTKYSDSYQSD